MVHIILGIIAVMVALYYLQTAFAPIRKTKAYRYMFLGYILTIFAILELFWGIYKLIAWVLF